MWLVIIKKLTVKLLVLGLFMNVWPFIYSDFSRLTVVQPAWKCVTLRFFKIKKCKANVTLYV